MARYPAQGWPRRLLTAALLWLALPAQALESPPLPVLKVALGENKPPYIIADGARGIEYELVGSVLRAAGYQPRIVLLPNQRAQQALADGRIDAAISNNGPFVSEPYIAYRNMAITLCQRHLQPKHITELGQYRVAAFHNAQRFLGAEFAAMARANAEYVESSPQPILNNLLFTGRTDVVISDLFIFLHFSMQPDVPLNNRQALCTHALFPPTQYALSFRDARARDRFNKALQQQAQAGLYQTLAQRYRLPGAEQPLFRP
ncbi:substrate-binding periplasmic protein [Vogesella fluminis]|uniref:Solute-binding protein family 3/N-terminal domain-containing protein n=1 Tax=Vogesella fluminis TaxID=1069161 RepID=A0ABQ3H6T4_9NEIS|nr:transporter substrate-binding domain-containing protein [Vogesella fluminis]GHD70571.1 hypothetical protein GCM10011419_01040 [Vogesella fluminis]